MTAVKPSSTPSGGRAPPCRPAAKPPGYHHYVEDHLFNGLGTMRPTRDSMIIGGLNHHPWRIKTGPFPACPACGAFLPPALPQPLAAALLLTRTLTRRERTVFQLLGVGYDNRSIARELQVSERTVKRYVTAILAKLQLRSRLQAGLSALILSCSLAEDAYCPEGLMDSSRTAGDDVRAHDTGGDHAL